MTTNHHEQMARLAAEAAAAIGRVSEYWEVNHLTGDFSVQQTGYPFAMSLDEQVFATWAWVENLEAHAKAYPTTAAALAAKPPLHIVKCSNPQHQHTTTRDQDDIERAELLPEVCHFCGVPAHYDEAIGWYQHDGDAPDCWRMKRDDKATPCVLV